MSKTRNWLWFVLSFALIAAFFLLREHWGHMLGLLPYLLLLACPFMHLFHGGHSGHSHHDDAAPRPEPKP